MTEAISLRRDLRERLARDAPVVAPGVYDCVSARLAERAGFDAVLVTGAGVAASLLGVPDLGLLTMSECLAQTRNIVQSVQIPVIADCDTGYGNPLNVARTVREFEAAGVAALFIEDQVAPKRCGHFVGKQVISTNEMVQKIHAAVDARTDPDLLLIARTDARAVTGITDAVKRAATYADAGAEALFVEAPVSEEELAYIATSLSSNARLMVNLVEGGRTPMVPVSTLADLGFTLITYSGSLQKTAIDAMRGMLDALRRDGSTDAYYPGRMVALDERSDLLGLPYYYELQQRYASD